MSCQQGCQVFTTKPAQLLLKTSPIAFRGGFIAFRGVKCMFNDRNSLVKFTFRGKIHIPIMLLGSLQPTDMKNNPQQQC